MRAPSISTAKSTKWHNVADLRTYGYRTSVVAHPDNAFIADYGMSKAFVALGISTEAGDWLQLGTGHSVKSKVGDTVYPATGATFSSEVNLRQGVVVATQSYGPKYCVDKFEVEISSGQEIVPLQRVSDVFFLSWMSLIDDARMNTIEAKASGLEHMFRWNTIVPEVQAHLKMVAGKDIVEIGEVSMRIFKERWHSVLTWWTVARGIVSHRRNASESGIKLGERQRRCMAASSAQGRDGREDYRSRPHLQLPFL